MRVLFLGFAVSNHTRRWCNALSAQGHEVLLLCQPDKRDNDNSFHEDVQIHYLKFGGKLGYYLNVPEVRRISSKFKPDIINAHFASGYGTTSRLAKLHPSVVSCWGSDVYSFPYKSRLHHYIICKNLKAADAIASTSFAMAEQIRKVLNEPNCQITVTPFGVDMDLFKKTDHKKNSRPIIGIVKYLEPIYDIELLIDAFSIICRKTKLNPLLHIYGGGSLKEKLVAKTKELGIDKDVFFFGTIPNTQVPDALSTFDVFVNCSKQESFGVAVVEAMACELPVVVTDTPGYREIVENNTTGIILKNRRPECMAEAIIKILSDASYASRIAHSGYIRAQELYDWTENVKTMINLYESLIRGT